MSLILEALRKSEAERRRGSTPDVAMELPPAAVARTRAMPAWLLPAVLLGAIALLAAWWWSQRDRNSANDEVPVVAAPVTEPRIATPSQPVVVTRPTPPIAPPQPAPSAATASQAPPAIVEPAPPPVRPLPAPVPAPAPPDTSNFADADAGSMPSIKLSMHMWDESPGKRFVILNGQRMGEGDRNGDIVVVAIERDGVIVERNGSRARVPLP